MAVEDPSKIITKAIAESNRNTQSSDITSNWPLSDYWGATSVNYAALGADRNELWTGGGDADIKEALGDKKTSPSQYPLNQVSASRTGHIFEIDDTSDNQRILLRHANQKTGVELRPDGGILISTPKGRVEVTGEDYTVLVEGDGKLVYKGNLDISVTGDFNIDCLNMNVNVRGNKKETIQGSHRKKITGNFGEEVVGGYSTTVAKQATSVYLGGHSNNVKGIYSNNVDGSSLFSSSGNTFITSETIVNVASNKVAVTGNDLTVQGGSGTIGGQGVNLFGKGAAFDEGVTAPTFHGDLDGTATTSTVTQSQTYASTATGSAGSITNTATPEFDETSTAEVSEYLNPYNNMAGGIREVSIDPGNFMFNFLDQTEATGGVTNKPVTTAEVRKRFRNTTNRTNTAFIQKGIETGSVCLTYNEPTPSSIGRLSAFEAAKPIQFISTVEDGYIPARRTQVQITPEPEYNPSDNLPITSKTKLAPGISLAKFLAGEDGGTNWDWVRSADRQLSIARYYYIHAQIMKTIADDDGEFNNYRLAVSEGLYRPGPTEILENGTLAQLMYDGRAVAYNLIDQNGNPATQKMFDLANFWKDQILYEKMILDYDTIDCNSPLSARIVVILPEIDDDWKATYNRVIETHYNGNLLAKKELVEVLPYTYGESGKFINNIQAPVEGDREPHHRLNQNLNTPQVGYDGTNGKLNPSTMIQIAPSGATRFGTGPLLLVKEWGERWFAMKAAAAKDGIELIPTAAYRSYTYQEQAYKNSKAINPGAVIAKPGRSNHGLGRAVDIGNARGPGDPVWEWLNKNAAIYGFRQKDSLKYKDPFHWSSTGG